MTPKQKTMDNTDEIAKMHRTLEDIVHYMRNIEDIETNTYDMAKALSKIAAACDVLLRDTQRPRSHQPSGSLGGLTA